MHSMGTASMICEITSGGVKMAANKKLNKNT